MKILTKFFKNKEFDKLLGKAVNLYNEKNFDEATKCYRDLLKKDNKNSRAQYGIGLSLFYNHNEEESIEHFRFLETNDPKTFPNLYYYLSKAYLILEQLDKSLDYIDRFLEVDKDSVEGIYLRAEICFNQENYDEALRQCETCIDKSSDFADPLIMAGEIFYRKEKLKEAIDCFNKAIEISPKSWKAYNLRGICNLKLDKDKEAKIDFVKALDEIQTEAEPFYWIAKLYAKIQDKEQAYENIDKCLKIDENFFRAAVLHSELKIQEELFDEALTDLNNLVDKKCKDPEIYFSRFNLKKRLEDYEGAREDLISAAKLNSTNENIYYELGKIECYLKNCKSALKAFDQAVEINPKSKSALMKRGKLKFKKKDYAGAAKDFTRIIESYPNEARAYLERALVKEKLSDNQAALSDYTKALMDNEMHEAFAGRGRLKCKEHNYEAALQDLNKSIKICSTNPVYFLLRAQTYKYLEMFTEALEDLNKAAKLENKDYRIYFLRGFINYSMNKFKEALADWNISLNINPLKNKILHPYINNLQTKKA